MCVVIDANTLSCVFKSSNVCHENFIPVLEWIICGRAKLSLGGKLLVKEIAEKQCSFMKFIQELKKIKKVHTFDDSQIDNLTSEIEKQIKDPDFDDPHIIALLIISKATILCSNDQRLFRFVPLVKKMTKGASDPKIYTSISHKPQISLLCEENICSCGDHHQLPQHVAESFMKLIEERR